MYTLRVECERWRNDRARVENLLTPVHSLSFQAPTALARGRPRRRGQPTNICQRHAGDRSILELDVDCAFVAPQCLAAHKMQSRARQPPPPLPRRKSCSHTHVKSPGTSSRKGHFGQKKQCKTLLQRHLDMPRQNQQPIGRATPPLSTNLQRAEKSCFTKRTRKWSISSPHTHDMHAAPVLFAFDAHAFPFPSICRATTAEAGTVDANGDRQHKPQNHASRPVSTPPTTCPRHQCRGSKGGVAPDLCQLCHRHGQWRLWLALCSPRGRRQGQCRGVACICLCRVCPLDPRLTSSRRAAVTLTGHIPSLSILHQVRMQLSGKAGGGMVSTAQNIMRQEGFAGTFFLGWGVRGGGAAHAGFASSSMSG